MTVELVGYCVLTACQNSFKNYKKFMNSKVPMLSCATQISDSVSQKEQTAGMIKKTFGITQ